MTGTSFSSTGKLRLRTTTALASVAFTVGMGFATTASAQSVLPTGGAVRSGAATISQASGSVTINQTTSRAIVNWSSFSVGASDRVTFNQPDAQSATLNRVTGNTTSQIAGRITGTGAVYIVNPNGIVITPTGTVQTGGGFIASTLDIADADFNAGNLRFTGNGASAAVHNAGTIVAGSGAYVALLGGSVSNSGTITVPMGRVGLGSGERIALDLSGDGFLQVALSTNADTGGAALIDHSGTITASGGYIQMSAATAKNAVRNVINIPGTLIADSATGQGGRIVLLGGAGGTVTASGTFSARGGGTGDGGSVETSGATVDFTGLRVDVRAANGKTGTWLVDPTNLTVDAAAAATINANLATANVTLSTDGYTATGPGTSSDGNGDIIINSALAWTSNTTLTLSAYHDIDINAAITAPAGSLTLAANNSGYQPASVIGASAAINVGTFLLNTGNWVQNAATLPGLHAASFTITNPNSASFLRVAGGDGSIANPYLLADIYGLQGLRSYSLLNQNFALASDIDASGTAGWNAGAGFAPIADNVTFSGSLDGKGHTISNLTINRTDSGVGLFARVNGTISNLSLTGGAITGYYTVGALVATQYGGSIINVSSSATVNGFSQVGGLVGYQLGSIANSSASGAITAVTGNAGGLVGLGSATAVITGSHASGNVSNNGRGDGTGGLVGSTGGSIDQSYATGSVTGINGSGNVGGLVGEVSAASITNSYATGNVAADNSTVGGLIGGVSTATITNAYATGSVTDTGTGQGIGGLIGATSGTNTISLVHATGDVRGTSFVGGLIGNASGTTSISQSYAGGHVYGTISVFGGLVGYLVDTASITSSYATGAVDHLTRTNDYGTYVGGLVGQANGTISNVYATGAVTGLNDSIGGLVGGITNANTLTNAHATGAVTGDDGSYVGGLVGYLTSNGGIANSYATGAVSGHTATGSVSIGGLVGTVGAGSKSDISKSFATGTVTATAATGATVGAGRDYAGGLIGDAEGYGAINQVYATGAVSGDAQVSSLGGLIGRLYDHGNGIVVSQAYATGSVTAIGTNTTLNYVSGDRYYASSHQNLGGLIATVYGTVTESYATGLITGGNLTGGLVALNDGGPGTSSSYWDTQATGQSDSDAGIGRTTAQMQDVNNFGTIFAGWDFTHIWAPPSAGYYPQLFALTPVISVQVYNQSTLYGTAPSGPLGTYYGGPSIYVFGPANDTLAGFVPYTTDATPNSNAGQYAITPYSGSSFTSSGGVDYRVVSSGPAILTINPISLTLLTAALTGNTTKLYDGTTTATLSPANFLLSGFINGDGAKVTRTTGTYASANAGTGIVVTANLTPSDFLANSGTYLGNYILPTSASGAIGTINPVDLTAALVGSVTKLYDGTTATTLNAGNFLLSGFINGEGAQINQTAGAYGGANVGNTVVTASLTPGNYVANTGTLLSNYVLPTSASGAIGTIDPLSLAVAFTGGTTKTYDGTTAATLTPANFLLSGFINGEGAQVTQAAGTYASANAGSGIVVTANLTPGNFVANSGTYLGNYILPTSVSGAIGTINPATLAVVTATLAGNITKTYDGTATATLNSGNFLLSGFVNGDGARVTQTVGTYASTNAGTGITVTANLTLADFQANAGTNLANYVLPTSASGFGTINPATLTVTYTANPLTRVYGSYSATDSGLYALSGSYTVSGLVGSDTNYQVVGGGATFTSAAGSTSNVGTYAVTGSGITSNGNYIVASVQAAGNANAISITPRDVQIVYYAAPSESIYGSPIPALTGSVGPIGLVNNDTLADAASGTAIFTTSATSASNVGTYGIYGSGLTAKAGNYNATFVQANFNAQALNIRPRTLSIINANLVGNTTKVYDGTNAATVNAGNFLLTGFANGDGATVTKSTGIYANASVGTGLTVQVSLTPADFVANAGTMLSNYILPNAAYGAIGTITPATLYVTYTANAATNVYGNPFAPQLTGTVTATGFKGADTMANSTVNSTIFRTTATNLSNVGTYAITGLNFHASSNYTVVETQAASNATAFTVTPAPLTVTYYASLTTNSYGDFLSNTEASQQPGFASNTVADYGVTLDGRRTGLAAVFYPNGSGDAASRYFVAIRPIGGYVYAVGLVNGDTVTGVTSGQLAWTTTATHLSNVGSYAVTGSGLSANNANYAFTFVQSSANATALTIVPRAVTITANPTTRTVGTANPVFTYITAGSTQFIPGLINGDVLTGALTSSATPGSATGQYLIQQGTLIASPNYSVTFSPGYLTITPSTTQTLTGSVPQPVTPVTVVPRPIVVAPRPVMPVYTPPAPPPPPARPGGPCAAATVSSSLRLGSPTALCTAG